nr:LysR family transcriptional regulator [Kibdelosporangium sp. MJ126-NF4]CEL14181.1 transcriptional regulator, LysR family [Kibdelosporangium sp. MJ126-NF4]
MDLGPQHLRMLDAVAAAGSISEAAARLDLGQPAVSRMLRRLENHLGFALFDRSSSGVRLTPMGAEVLSRTRATLAGIAEVNSVLRRPPAGAAGPLRIGGQASPAFTHVGARIAALWPSRRVELRMDQGSGRILALLASGALDIGMIQVPVGYSVTVPAEVEQHVLVLREPEFVGMAEHCPLAARQVVDLADLADHEWLDDPVDDGPWPGFLRRQCAKAGFTPQVGFWSTNWDFGTSVIRSGRAVAIYFPTARPREGVVFRPLRGNPLAHRVILLWRREARVAALRLRDEIGRAYLELVAANPLYTQWWNENADAHPALPTVVGRVL